MRFVLLPAQEQLLCKMRHTVSCALMQDVVADARRERMAVITASDLKWERREIANSIEGPC
jgi:hypothetical protein